MRTGSKIFVAIAGILALALITGSGVLMFRLATESDSASAQPAPPAAAPATPEAPQAVPLPTETANPEDTVKDIAVASGWLDDVSQRTRIPRRALQAYVSATMWAANDKPACGLQWNTLAAIGAVESDHGRMGGGQISESGDMSADLVGPRLDGSGKVRRIEDTDRGRFDGDTEFDRAVGPMQFIPQSWNSWGRDGNGDGKKDPQNIDDAALTAAAYLCNTGNLSSSAGWDRAVRSYNDSEDYVTRVYTAAAGIARIVSPGAKAPAPATAPATPSR